MTRYVKTFVSDDALDQFEEHSGPMLSMLVAAHGPLPVKAVRGAGVDPRVKQRRSFKEQRRRHLEFVKTMCVAFMFMVSFSTVLSQYSTSTTATLSLLRALLGDIDYEELSNAHWFMGPSLFFFFVGINVFSQMLSAVVESFSNKIYLACAEERAKREDIAQQCLLYGIAPEEDEALNADESESRMQHLAPLPNFIKLQCI